MINIDKAFKSERSMLALTGLNRKAFNLLLNTFLPLLPTSNKKKLKRKFSIQTGRPHSLDTPKAKLFFILFYLKCYPTFDLAGLFFEVNRSNACRWVKMYLPLVEKALGKKQCLPKRQLHSMEEFFNAFPKVRSVIVDALERPIQRPKDNIAQQQSYSGKKKDIRISTP